jgi:hypothetical protein
MSTKFLWYRKASICSSCEHGTEREICHDGDYENYCLLVCDAMPSRGYQFLFLSFSGWGETESTWYFGLCWPTVPAPDDR